MSDPGLAGVRLDKWLWAARFFKTRQLAIEAIKGGKVHLNGQRSKPGKEIRVGNRLEIQKGGLHWEVLVRGLSVRRGPAAQAQLLYEETPESLARRAAEMAQRRLRREAAEPGGRPNKRERRLIHRFKQEAG